MSFDIDVLEYDVVVVGAGPAGLAAAIRCKQINPKLSVVIIEKSAEVGDHILSGAIIDPIGIDRLLPRWREEKDHPFLTLVEQDIYCFLNSKKSINLPGFFVPNFMDNKNNYIVSLGQVCRWLKVKAEAIGVEIYCGITAAEICYGKNGEAIGIFTGEKGRNYSGTLGKNYIAPTLLLSKYMLIGEGACGSITQKLIERYSLSEGCQPQKFGLGVKELWKVNPKNYTKGSVLHSFGWPLDMKTSGGGFIYQFNQDLVSVGFILHLDYQNPWLSAYDELQRFKTHPNIKSIFDGGERIEYGARLISEGGWQSVPKLSFPGGSLIGCSAGFVNLVRIKGSHNAVLSGILAAEKIVDRLSNGYKNDDPIEIESSWRNTCIGKDLWIVRNFKPLLSRFGILIGLSLGFIDIWFQRILGFSFLGTLKHYKLDHASLDSADKHKRINYPKYDGKLTFDISSSLLLSKVRYSEDQPNHIIVKDKVLQEKSELGVYSGPSMRYCPAGVYEWHEHNGEYKYIIHSQNCIHCKTCVVKDPNRNIEWKPPQGDDGPCYYEM
ncbi:electron transfer flavoprotein-ubiquinone oxidoreductase [Candidatus Liberibacter americanus]|uniref:Electron transfer flavoprotein-ubiquinone oxidoreductase n=1 Tax=Candidatus Liberibacter americanus str. Sao Paulo TaxID=1261131 RepID=U6B5C6_9HYPH|nr:electron-transfer flavoprotein:ubiquinone oxidoreductase [Candidatus Liberibacter americanus]AHA28140.1 Electron transfer flavoprotein-ubiquinone oxidoreductase [Candidatus Liberibacter americanus str. Sao Paulo]EMS35948.1 electron transfer flavoprotein-ubiquinone oxidoreductase [Candidatus Liberibacter americanus PW_SP]